MFHNRVEIISPGKLFNSLTVEKIKLGVSIRRNQTLDRICSNILPYTGRGSGIKRVLKINPNVEFINDIELEQFKAIIYRDNLGVNQDNLGVNQDNLGVKLSKNKRHILDLIRENPNITIEILSHKVGISTTAIENNLRSLKKLNIIKRVGSDKSGHWEINRDN